jgi:hypothetical protein
MDIYTPPGWALEHGISGRIPAVDAGVDAIALHFRNDASRQHADEWIGIMLMEQGYRPARTPYSCSNRCNIR